MALKPISADEQRSAKSTVNGNVVVCERSVKPRGERDAPVYAVKWSLDFSGLARETLLKLASNAIIIMLQGDFRKAEGWKTDAWGDRKVNVAEYLEEREERRKASRGPVDPKVAADRNLAKLAESDPETLAALLKKYASK